MSKTSAIIFFGIILVGLGISLYTFKDRFGKTAAGPEDAVPAGIASIPPQEAGTVPEEAPAPAKEPSATGKPVAEEKSTTPEPSAAPAPALFKSPAAAVAALAGKIDAKDYEGFVEIVGPGTIAEPIRETVRELIENPGLKLDPGKPHVEISKSAGGLRWAFNFVPAVGEGAPRQLYADLTELPDQGIDIAKVSLPLSPDPTRGGAPESASGEPAAAAPEIAQAIEASDALTVAQAFSEAVIRRDFKIARGLADPGTVTDERVAALMIAVEEGKFALKKERPFVVTLARDDLTWVLARVESDASSSEFAVELGKIDQAWKVNGLTFSKVLSALSEAAGGGDVAYSPIVENPEGGDSLVLYFEFDDASLSPRSERQLAIVAGILAQSEERVIRINGHADALGNAAYNVGLSDRRAESIRQALIRNGAKPSQVVTEAFGSAKPRKPNFLPDGSDNPTGRSENRRAEVLLDF